MTINLYRSSSESYDYITQSELIIPDDYSKTYLNPRRYHQSPLRQIQIIDKDLSDTPIYIKDNFIYSQYTGLDSSIIEMITDKLHDNSILVELKPRNSLPDFEGEHSTIEISKNIGSELESCRRFITKIRGIESLHYNRTIYILPENLDPIMNNPLYYKNDGRARTPYGIICIIGSYYLVKVYAYELNNDTYIGFKFKSKNTSSSIPNLIFKNKDRFINQIIHEFKSRIRIDNRQDFI